MTDSKRLKEVIQKSGLKINTLLDAAGIRSYATLRAKINNQSEFTAAEITALCELLCLEGSERDAIFFAQIAESHSA